MNRNKSEFPAKKNPKRKRWLIIGCVVLLSVAIVAGVLVYKDKAKDVEIPLSEAIALSKDNVFSEMRVGNVVTLVVADDVIQRTTTDIQGKTTILLPKQKVDVKLMGYSMKDLKDLGFVMPPVYKEEAGNWWDRIVGSSGFLSLVMLIVAIGGFILVYKTGLLTGFSGSTFKKDKKSISFADVGGASDIKDSLMEAVSFLRDKKYLEKLGAKIPHGILLSGAPGVGKTMLARAMATEADAPFYFCSGSELQSYWFGLTAQKVKKLFKQAKSQPSIVFIDEIDSIAQRRSFRGTDVSRDNDMTLNQILAEMDGFDKNSNVLVVAATNHPEVLDPALLRQGRFDRQINIPLPTFQERCEIFKIHSKGRPLADDVKVDDVGKQTSGMSGADLAAICNEASIIAGREHKDAIDMADINRALDRVLAGCERKGKVFSDSEKRLVAYHESGHALVASLLKECDKVQRISILPHGDSGGFTRLSSENEVMLMSKSKAQAMISMMLGGRVAEELVIGDISSGAQNDIMKANQIAREMVEHYGMGDNFGLRYCGQVSMGIKDVSPESQAIIDGDVSTILKDCYGVAKGLIEGKRTILDMLASRLIEVEVLDADVVSKIINA
jgi:cell division protease FtsH